MPTENQIKLLRTALKTTDRTILAVGFNKANPYADFPSFHQSTANALVKRGFLEFFRKAIWGTVYKLTATGEQFIKSYDSARPSGGSRRSN